MAGVVRLLAGEKEIFMSNYYSNLLSQAQKLYRHNRQGSYRTKERYFEAYKRFLRFVGEEYHLQKISNVSGKHLSAYVQYMKQKGYAPSTIKTDLAAIRFWQDKVSDAKYVLPKNAEFDLQRRKFGGVDRTWSMGELNRMITECWKAGHDEYGACMVLARFAGLRLHEVLRMDTAIARAAIKNGELLIKGKGGKVRAVPVIENVRIILEKYIKQTPPGEKLFVPHGKETHIVKQEIQQFISAHREKIRDPGSERHLTFHGLRHTCAAEWYEQFRKEGKTESEAKRQVSKLLGHEREDVTRIYLAGVKGGEDNV